MKRFITLLIIVLCTLGSSLSWARVNVAQTKRLHMPEVADAEVLSKEFMDRVLPKTIHAEEDGNRVLSRMADSTVSYWWDTSPLRKTRLGQTADAIEQKARLQGEVQGDNDVTHKFDLKVLLAQALARFEYKGWINAGINYDARAAETEAEIIQPLSDDKDLVVSQTVNSFETTSRVSFQFDW